MDTKNDTIYKVRIFPSEDSSNILEHNINSFLKSDSNIKIIDIKYQTFSSRNGYRIEYSAMVIYEILK